MKKIIRSLRESLDLHTRFALSEALNKQIGDTVRDAFSVKDIQEGYFITLMRTHYKLIYQAQKQNILHKDIGYFRVLELQENVFFYDIGLRAIDGSIFARGFSLNLDEAVARAFGELYERVSMSFAPLSGEMYLKSISELEKEQTSFLNLKNFPSPTVEQTELFRDMKWDKNTKFQWSKAQYLISKKEVLVPTQLLYWRYNLHKDESYITEINTNGLGAGYSIEDAIESAASELLQRHAFFSFWYSKTTPPKISTISVLQNNKVNLKLKKLVSAVLSYGLEIHLVNCTLENTSPSVATILTRQGMGFIMGMSSNISLEKAIERSLCEALSVYTWVFDDITRLAPVTVFNAKSLLSDFTDKQLTSRIKNHTWSYPQTINNGSFFISGNEHSFNDFDSINLKPSESLVSLSKNEIVIKTATKKYLTEIDFHVVRLISPPLYKLALNERFSTPILGSVIPKNTFPSPFP